jgi:hypothetical protein
MVYCELLGYCEVFNGRDSSVTTSMDYVERYCEVNVTTSMEYAERYLEDVMTSMEYAGRCLACTTSMGFAETYIVDYSLGNCSILDGENSLRYGPSQLTISLLVKSVSFL